MTFFFQVLGVLFLLCTIQIVAQYNDSDTRRRLMGHYRTKKIALDTLHDTIVPGTSHRQHIDNILKNLRDDGHSILDSNLSQSIMEYSKEDLGNSSWSNRAMPYSQIHEYLSKFSPYDIVDLVLTLDSTIDIPNVLGKWKSILLNFHLIILSDDSITSTPSFPTWLDFEYFSLNDIRHALGDMSTIVDEFGLSNRQSLVTLGAWISNREYVFIIDPDSIPIDPDQMLPQGSSNWTFMERHLYAALSPSLPYYHAGPFDPFAPGFDFVKGYPYYLRRGHITAVSQGLFASSPFYDAFSRVTKPWEKAQADNVPSTTVALGSMFSLSLRNIMYRQPDVGCGFVVFRPSPNVLYDGHNLSSFASFAEIIAGWVWKVGLDHSGYGVKIGPPYVSSTFEAPDEELQTILHFSNETSWPKIAFEFFHSFSVQGNLPCMSGGEIPLPCYMKVLADEMEVSLGSMFPYFKTYANLLRKWIVVWDIRKGFLRDLFPVSSLSSRRPYLGKNSTCAVLTISHNEKFLLPVWIRHYSRHVPVQDIYILDHMTSDGSLDPSELPAGINVIQLTGNNYHMPVQFRSTVVKKYQDRFLREGYACVLFTDTDELIAPNPTVYPGGLKQYLEKFVEDPKRLHHIVVAWEIGHMSYGNGTSGTGEPPLNWSDSLLKQRHYYVPDPKYNKPLLSKRPLAYRPGFHRLYNPHQIIVTDVDLIMFHIRSIDMEFCLRREEWKYNMTKTMERAELYSGYASHWNTYERDKKSGELCRYAVGCYFGKDTSTIYDNTGTVKMLKLEDYWSSVLM